MRWLVCHPGPNFSVHDTYVGWVEALHALGENVTGFNLDDRLTFYDSTYLRIDEQTMRKALEPEKAVELAVNGLYAALYKTHPDVLFVVSAFLIPHELMDLARLYGTKVVVLHTESPYEDGRQLEVAAHADLNLVNDPINIDRFRALASTEYFPHAYRPGIHHPGPPEPDLASDFTFVGTGFESRIAFFEAMNLDGIDVALGGNWQQLGDGSPLHKHLAHDITECLDNADTARLYRSSKVGINFYRREAETGDLSTGWAMGPREVEMAACGLFFLRDPRDESDQVLGMLPTFATPEDASDQLRWWLARDTRRDALAGKACDAVAGRAFINSAKRLLRLLDRQPVTV